jgi:hypothetical protein
MDDSAVDTGLAGSGDASVDRTADGSWLIMSMLHRRMRLTAQADAMGIELPGRDVGVEADARAHAYLYDVVLGQLRAISDRVDNQGVARLAKGAARQLKYLKEIDRNGALFEEHELDGIGRLLGRAPTGLRYHWDRAIRDDWLMRPASGALYERGWPALR